MPVLKDVGSELMGEETDIGECKLETVAEGLEEGQAEHDERDGTCKEVCSAVSDEIDTVFIDAPERSTSTAHRLLPSPALPRPHHRPTLRRPSALTESSPLPPHRTHSPYHSSCTPLPSRTSTHARDVNPHTHSSPHDVALSLQNLVRDAAVDEAAAGTFVRGEDRHGGEADEWLRPYWRRTWFDIESEGSFASRGELHGPVENGEDGFRLSRFSGQAVWVSYRHLAKE